jgi:hypothetical protein
MNLAVIQQWTIEILFWHTECFIHASVQSTALFGLNCTNTFHGNNVVGKLVTTVPRWVSIKTGEAVLSLLVKQVHSCGGQQQKCLN